MQRLLQPPTSPPIPGRKRSVRTKPFEQAVMMRNTRRNVRKAAIELKFQDLSKRYLQMLTQGLFTNNLRLTQKAIQTITFSCFQAKSTRWT